MIASWSRSHQAGDGAIRPEYFYGIDRGGLAQLGRAGRQRRQSDGDDDELQCRWMERWIDQLVRENSYPPQLRSADFYSLLGTFFSGDVALAILERCRNEFARAFPLTQKAKEDDLSWLAAVLRSDPAALQDMPKDYLTV